MKRNYLIFLLALFYSIQGYSQVNPFDSLKFDKVVAYEFQGNGGRDIKYTLKYQSLGLLNKEKLLSSNEIDSFEKIICSPKSYGNESAMCFIPHFAVIYYLEKEPVAYVDVCFKCDHLKSSINIPAFKDIYISKYGDEDIHYDSVRNVYSFEIWAVDGFSAKGYKQLYSFVHNLGFTKYLQPEYSRP